MLSKVNLLGVNITTASQVEIIDAIKTYLKSSKYTKPLTIATPNPEQVVLAYEQTEFRTTLNEVDIALPDGAGIVWAIHKQTGRKIARLTGTDFMLDLVKLASDNNYTVGLVGGLGPVATDALNKLQTKYAGLSAWSDPGIIGVKSAISDAKSAVDDYIKSLSKNIKETQTKIIFLAFGAPEQEFVMHQLATKASGPVVIMVVGGAFDYISGQKKRAPILLQNMGFEWLWRLVSEPSRLTRQFALPKFVFLVLRARAMLQSK